MYIRIDDFDNSDRLHKIIINIDNIETIKQRMNYVNSIAHEGIIICYIERIKNEIHCY